MPTSTFYKNIVLGPEAAERLAQILSEPAPPNPKLADGFWEENDKKVKEFLSKVKTR